MENPDTDLVTQLQLQVNRLLSLMYNFTGSLQRDAPAASVRGEPAEPGSTLDVPGQTAMMAEQLVSAFEPVQALIDKLPDAMVPEDQELQQIAELQRESDSLQHQLSAATQEAQATLARAQDVHATLAHLKLRQRAAAVAATVEQSSGSGTAAAAAVPAAAAAAVAVSDGGGGGMGNGTGAQEPGAAAAAGGGGQGGGGGPAPVLAQ